MGQLSCWQVFRIICYVGSKEGDCPLLLPSFDRLVHLLVTRNWQDITELRLADTRQTTLPNRDRLAVTICRSKNSVQVVKKYHPVIQLLDLIGKTFGP